MAEQSKHIISSFDAALYGLKNDVLLMSSLTDRMFQAAVEGLLNRDSDLCNQVVADDDEIDLLEKKGRSGRHQSVGTLSAGGIGYEGGYLGDEDQHKLGAHRRPIRHHCTES